MLTWAVCVKPHLPGCVSRAQEAARQASGLRVSALEMETGYWLDFIKPQAGGPAF